MHELQRHAVRAQHGGELPLSGLEHVEAAIQAGMTRVKKVGNHMMRPEAPLMATPQNTAT